MIPHSVTKGLLFLVHVNCILNIVFSFLTPNLPLSPLCEMKIWKVPSQDCRKAQTRENGQYTCTNFVWGRALQRGHYYKVSSIYKACFKAFPTWCNSQPLTGTLRYIRHSARCCVDLRHKISTLRKRRSRLEKKKQTYHQIFLSVLKENAKEAYRRGMCYKGLGI